MKSLTEAWLLYGKVFNKQRNFSGCLFNRCGSQHSQNYCVVDDVESLKQRNFSGCLFNRCGSQQHSQNYCVVDDVNETLTESSAKHIRIFMKSCITEPICLVRLPKDNDSKSVSFPCSLQSEDNGLDGSFTVYGLNNVILGNGSTGVDLTIGRWPQIVSLNQDVQFNVPCHVNLLSLQNDQLCHFRLYNTPQLTTLNIANPVIFSCSRNYSDLNWWLMKYNTTHFVNLQKLNISGFTFEYTFNSSLDNDLIIVCGTEKNSTIDVLGVGAFRANNSSSRTTPTSSPAGHEHFPTALTQRVQTSATPSIGDGITSNVTLSDNGETRSNMALTLAFAFMCLVVGIIIGICSVLIGPQNFFQTKES